MTNDSPDITGALCRAMEALQDRPVLFKYVLDELGIARRSAVVRCFIDALTRGGVYSYIIFLFDFFFSMGTPSWFRPRLRSTGRLLPSAIGRPISPDSFDYIASLPHINGLLSSSFRSGAYKGAVIKFDSWCRDGMKLSKVLKI